MKQRFGLFYTLLALLLLLGVFRYSTSAYAESCPGTLPTRLAVGKAAGVHPAESGQEAVPVRVREKAGIDAQIVAQLQVGDTFIIRNGPVCVDNYTWWQIEAIPNLTGWVAESSGNIYLIDPIDPPTVIPATPEIRPAVIDCPEALPTQFNTGMRGVVRSAIPEGATPNSVRVRENASAKAKQIGLLQQDMPFTVTDGPQCAENFIWWRIRADSGLVGWVAESVAGKYTIIPLRYSPQFSSNAPSVIIPVDCPGALPTRLRWEVRGRAITTMPLYSAPEFTAPPEKRTRANEPFSGIVNSGTEFRVGSLTGMGQAWHCADSIIWWSVLLNGDQIEGWLPESQNRKYVIEPVSQTVTATPIRYIAPPPTQTPTLYISPTASRTATSTAIPSDTPVPSITFTPSVVPTSGATFTPPPGNASAISVVAFAPDDMTFLAGYADGKARLWETETGRLLRQLDANMKFVVNVGFSPDGMYAFTADRNGYVYLWRIAGDQPPVVYDVHSNGELTCAQLSPDGRFLLTCNSDGTARLWTIGTPDPPVVLNLKTKILSGAFNSKNRAGWSFILLGTADNRLTVWWRGLAQVSRASIDQNLYPIRIIEPNNMDFVILGREYGAPDFIMQLSFDRNDDKLPSGNIEIYQQNLATRGRRVTAIAGSGVQFALAFADVPGIQLYYSAPPTGGLDPQAGMFVASGSGYTGTISSIAFGNKAGRYLLTGGSDTVARLWHIPENLDVGRLSTLTEIRQYRLPYRNP